MNSIHILVYTLHVPMNLQICWYTYRYGYNRYGHVGPKHYPHIMRRDGYRPWECFQQPFPREGHLDYDLQVLGASMAISGDPSSTSRHDHLCLRPSHHTIHLFVHIDMYIYIYKHTHMHILYIYIYVYMYPCLPTFSSTF